MAGKTDGDKCQFPLMKTLEEATQQGEALHMELKRNREVLSELQGTFVKLDRRREAMQFQLNAKEREIQNISEKMAQEQARASDLESESQAIYVEIVKMQQEIEESAESFQLMLAKYNTYRAKMESHKMAIFTQESQTAVHQALADKRRLVYELREERDRLRTDLENPEGSVMRRAQKEVEELKVQVCAMKQQVLSKTQLLVKEDETQAQLREDIQIQNRRCEAILKRLRCQLNKAQSNHRQLTEDICWLRKEAADLRWRLAIQEGTQDEF